MKRKSFYISMLFAALSFSSCELTEINPNQTGLDQSVSDPEKARYILDGCYGALQNSYLFRCGQNSNGIREHDAMADAAYNNWSTGLIQIARGDHDANHGMIRGFWKANYNGISRCNLFIDSFSNSDIPQKDQYLAEAKAMRAFYYFNLTNYFGNVPLILKPLQREEAYYVKRHPRAETLDIITKDLLWAVEHLKDRKSTTEANRYQFSKGAALGLLTRIYLYRASRLDDTNMDSWVWKDYTGEVTDATKAREFYALARDAAKNLMDNYDYKLEANFEDLFNGTKENGVESLFEVQFVSGVGEGECFSGTYVANPQPWIVPTVEMVATYLQKDGTPITDDTSADILLNNMDPRYYTTVLTSGQMWCGQKWTGKGINYGKNPYMKYGTRKYVRTEPGLFTDGDRNFIVMRYADILLMYAEAKMKLNEIDAEMFDALDQVRSRPSVSMPLWDRTVTDVAVLFEELQKERLREFALEGLRYQDMIRWGIYSEIAFRVPSAKYDDNFDYRRYVWPVPQTECDNNRSEEGLQNPGW